MTKQPPELTATQHCTRVRLLVAGAVAATLVLGFAVIAADVAREPNRTDAPFWQRLWDGTRDRLRTAGEDLSLIKRAGMTPEKEAKDLSEQVFPQFE